jgi:DNA-binding TFAR19-related protein (PDSD5 family)
MFNQNIVWRTSTTSSVGTSSMPHDDERWHVLPRTHRESRHAVQRIHLVKAEKAKQVEDAILARAQRGQLGEKVSEEMVIQMLQAGGRDSERAAGSTVVFKRRDLDDDDEW